MVDLALREIDLKVAAHEGWTNIRESSVGSWIGDGFIYDRICHGVTIPFYTTDGEPAMRLVSKYKISLSPLEGEWIARRAKHYSGLGPTPCEAICSAILSERYD